MIKLNSSFVLDVAVVDISCTGTDLRNMSCHEFKFVSFFHLCLQLNHVEQQCCRPGGKNVCAWHSTCWMGLVL